MIATTDFGCAFECRSEGDGVAAFAGVASTNREDDYGTVIETGAFDPIGHVVMLRDHDKTQIIGGWRKFEQRGNELHVDGELNLGVEKARETYALMKCGHLTGLSVGFTMPADGAVRDAKTGRRHIRKAKLREISIVGFPATPGAGVTSVRTVDEWLAVHGIEYAALAEPTEILKREETAAQVRGTVDSLLQRLRARA